MKNTVLSFQEAKNKGKKLTMLTAYDYSMAKLVDTAGVNAILVGDSLGMVMLGYEDTIRVTMEDMIHHTAAVSRGAKKCFNYRRFTIFSVQYRDTECCFKCRKISPRRKGKLCKIRGRKRSL
ncbi:3-methyl-2-oxobutanoate hydroxymethyltransferase [Fusobacterium necrophorum subsp. funduliforme 1_1_36S]|nr:3-methyl-2-oxobutanoate hydroxymethyltransferase [Fusobacterium necrophorum subsp. funduliforme 1_1_36S]